MNQHDVKQELVNYTREADLRNVPMWLKEAIKAWVEAVELGQNEYSYYDAEKVRVSKRTDYATLDELLELDEGFDKYRNWLHKQKVRYDRVK